LTKNKQLVDNNKQVVDNNKQVVDNNKQLVDNNKQVVDNNKQLVDNNKQVVDNNKQLSSFCICLLTRSNLILLNSHVLSMPIYITMWYIMNCDSIYMSLVT